MKPITYATVPSHIVSICGRMDADGWGTVDPSEPGSREVEFTFSIQDDGSGNFLLVCSSLDGTAYADTWHQTQEEAMECAESKFGVRHSSWVLVR